LDKDLLGFLKPIILYQSLIDALHQSPDKPTRGGTDDIPPKRHIQTACICLVSSALVRTISEDIPTSVPLVEHSMPSPPEQKTCRGLSEMVKRIELDTDILGG